MKTKVPQFELPVVGSEAFNLFGETAEDGERLRQETEADTQRARQADELQKKQQPDLI